MKKTIIYFFIFFLIFFNAQSNEVTYKVLGKSAVYSMNPELKVYVNEKCSKPSCIALAVFKKYSSLDCSKFLFFNDKNPANIICLEHLNGEIDIGQDLKGNEISFCFFKDKSSVIADSLIRLCK